MRQFLAEEGRPLCSPKHCFGWRAGWRNVVRLDAQLQPPHRQHRQAAAAVRAERLAVVGPDGRRQPVFCENPLQNRTHARRRRLDDIDGDQVAAQGVGDGQRIAAAAIAGAVPALDINGPFAARRHHPGNHVGYRDRPPGATAALDQPCAFQDVADRRQRRPGHPKHLVLQPAPDLLRPKVRELAPHRDNRAAMASSVTCGQCATA